MEIALNKPLPSTRGKHLGVNLNEDAWKRVTLFNSARSN